MKHALLIIGLLAVPTCAYSWTGECYEDGEMFAQEFAATEYCEKEPNAKVSEMQEVGAVDLCDSPPELRALKSGCMDALIPAIAELYFSGECEKFKHVKDSPVRIYSLKRRLCK
ncbi:hypothetical protein [Oligoflexus tunisiensis]|uniref:hypothetical protein n=1 Tax=Oligoflexus tunisiensis TaxID=708132 RepID=UPI00114D1148|nr:hypothetical protein [Oligoflexus tunisiensis]